MKPAESKLTGEILGISDVLHSKGRDYRMLTLTTGVIPVNEKFYQRNAARFEKGSFITLVLQTTIAGQTTYVDKSGVEHTHTSSGQSIVSVSSASKIDILKFAAELIPEEATAARQNALATMYQGAVARM